MARVARICPLCSGMHEGGERLYAEPRISSMRVSDGTSIRRGLHKACCSSSILLMDCCNGHWTLIAFYFRANARSLARALSLSATWAQMHSPFLEIWSQRKSVRIM